MEIFGNHKALYYIRKLYNIKTYILFKGKDHKIMGVVTLGMASWHDVADNAPQALHMGSHSQCSILFFFF